MDSILKLISDHFPRFRYRFYYHNIFHVIDVSVEGSPFFYVCRSPRIALAPDLLSKKPIRLCQILKKYTDIRKNNIVVRKENISRFSLYDIS